MDNQNLTENEAIIGIKYDLLMIYPSWIIHQYFFFTCWIILTIICTGYCIYRTQSKWKEKTTPHNLLQRYVLMLNICACVIRSFEMIDPFTWSGIYTAGNVIIMRKLGQVIQILCWFLIVLFWRNMVRTAENESKFTINHNGTFIYISMAIIFVIVFVAAMLASYRISFNMNIAITNAILSVCAVLFMVGGIWFSLKASVIFSSLDKKWGRQTWSLVIIKMRVACLSAVTCNFFLLVGFLLNSFFNLSPAPYFVYLAGTHFFEFLISLIIFFAVYKGKEKSLLGDGLRKYCFCCEGGNIFEQNIVSGAKEMRKKSLGISLNANFLSSNNNLNKNGDDIVDTKV